jgi:AcrR family transcriptional regulator
MSTSGGSPSRATTKRSAPGAEGLLDTALECFYRYGYAGTSVRQIASEADVTVAALYHHFSSKQEILFTIMTGAMESALDAVQTAHATAGSDPADRLVALVEAMVRYHTRFQAEAFVGNSELRSLEKRNRASVVELRDEFEALFDTAILDGVEQGVFDVRKPLLAARAVIAMCIAVSTWYSRGGGLSPTEISELYSHYALSLVGHRGLR